MIEVKDEQTTASKAVLFPTGHGKSYTHALLVNGKPNPSPRAGTPYDGISGIEIARMAASPQSCDKLEAQWAIPSTYLEHDARDHEPQALRGQFRMLVLDVDKNNLDLPFILECVEGVLGKGCSAIAYSTRSSTPEDRRWRVLVPLAEAIPGPDYHDTALAFFALLQDESQGTLIIDPPAARFGQIFFLPNRGEHYEHQLLKGTRVSLTADHPVIQRRENDRDARAEAEAEARKARDERQARRAAVPVSSGETPMDAFNSRHSVADLLMKYGYLRAGSSKDYRSRYQTSGSFATRDMGDHWVSLSGSDDAAGIGFRTSKGSRAGDAFDLYAHYEHDSDLSKAASAYAKEIGLHDMNEATATFELLCGIPKAETTASPASTPGEMPDWRSLLICNTRGKPVFNTANAMLVMEMHPDWLECFAFDSFRQVKILTSPIPGTKSPRSSFKPRDFKDADAINAVAWFNRNGFPDATKTTVFDAIETIMHEHTYHPVRNYLHDLPAWDGTKRIAAWLKNYCAAKVEGPEHERYVAEVGMRWMISAVARVLQPGCKADGVLILEGEQGAFKSTTLRTICGDEWFGDALPPMSSKDASDYLRGKWIIELAELSNINKSEVEIVKAFISREEERFRPAYGRNEISYPRQCIFAGSTNKSDYLRDETGNRRFWPVRVGRKCDTQGIKRDRNQLWAEALAMYRAGEKWWLEETVIETAKAQQEKRVSEDAWQSTVLDFANKQTAVSPTQIARQALMISLERIDRMVSNRITAILTANGWVRTGKFTSGDNKDQARFERAQS